MNQWIAVSRTEHASLGWWPRQGYRFAAQQQVVPLLLAELDKLLPSYALGFTYEAERYHAVALLGLGSGRNLYLHPDGRWLASYVPASLRGYPFTLARTGNDQLALCVEQGSLTEEPSAQPLFDDERQLAERVQRTLDFLNQCEKSRQATQGACQALDAAGVIEPWPLHVAHGADQEPLKVQGIYRINEKVMNGLSADTFGELRSHGALALAYAQLFSMNRLSQLSERARFHEQFHAQQQANQPVADNSDELFGNDDDELIFDFDR